MNRSPLRTFLLIPLALACFALSPPARAVCQEGCLPNQNTVLGEDALTSNTTGFDNTAMGFDALFSNTSGNFNTAIGHEALTSNTTGFSNTATGDDALIGNTTGAGNTAIGVGALVSNTTGFSNTATGIAALFSNTTGNNNIALGQQAGRSLTTGHNNIDIGNLGVAGEARTIRIGTIGTHTKTFIAGISGETVPDGVGVIVGANGKLGTVVSSARFKNEIKPMDKTSEAILALRPVTFRYKHELDPDGVPQFGLVAEEVEKVNPDLVARDASGKAYTVRYEAVNAMLLNEFLKQHRKGKQQDRKIEKLEATIAKQQKQIQALTTGLQKVSDQLELSKPALRTVLNNH
jgi:trimeric autotransporter adhesin